MFYPRLQKTPVLQLLVIFRARDGDERSNPQHSQSKILYKFSFRGSCIFCTCIFRSSSRHFVICHVYSFCCCFIAAFVTLLFVYHLCTVLLYCLSAASLAKYRLIYFTAVWERRVRAKTTPVTKFSCRLWRRDGASAERKSDASAESLYYVALRVLRHYDLDCPIDCSHCEQSPTIYDVAGVYARTGKDQ